MKAATILFTLGLLCARNAALAQRDIDVVPATPGQSVADLRGRTLAEAQANPASGTFESPPDQRELRQHSLWTIGSGDFTIRATLTLDRFEGRGAGFVFDGGSIALDDPNWPAVLTGRLFGGGSFPFESDRPGSVRPGAPIEVAIERRDGFLAVSLNEFEVGRIGLKDFVLGRIGFDLGGGTLRIQSCTAAGDIGRSPRPIAVFTGADGDIDEYRDPAIARAGDELLVCAVAVSTRADGGTAEQLSSRRGRVGGAFEAIRTAELGELTPDLIGLGASAGASRPWILIVQAAAPNRLVEELVLLDSADGVAFEERARIRSTEGPLRIVGGAMFTHPDGTLTLGATRIEQGKPVAVEIAVDPRGPTPLQFSIRRAGPDASCDPIRFDHDTVVVRTPGDTQRSVLRGGSDAKPTLSNRFEGSATIAAPVGRRAEDLRLAQADPVFPYPLREVGSDDGGASWTKRSTLWGGAAGYATALRAADRVLVLFEGGDKARREHVLLLELPAETAVVKPTSEPQTRSP